MDIHPLVVHFPIALLTIYSLLEVFRKWTTAPHWKNTRCFLVIIGTLSAFASLATGETAEHMMKDRSLHNVLEMHSLIGSATTWIYGILAAAYLVVWARSYAPANVQKIVSLADGIVNGYISLVLAILGFIGLALTGALGAIMVYGPDFDPMTSLVYKVLFGS